MSDRVVADVDERPTLNYSFAAAPDIIRAHQKDAYFEGILLDHLSNLTRRIYGARFVHTYTTEGRTFSELIYHGLTTFIGNRTLGEEYCDIVQIENDTMKLPAISRRAGYILTRIVLPYVMTKILPLFRSRVQVYLESNLEWLTQQKREGSWAYRILRYLLSHLATITSPSPIHALTLTVFYFSGAYYQLSKRIWGLRYIFTKKVAESEARIGYEVLGVLLLLQITVQTWLHLQNTLQASALANGESMSGGTAVLEGGVEVSMDPRALSPNNELLIESSAIVHSSITKIGKMTNTKILSVPRFDLQNTEIMPWIKGQNRKCTLCLEELKDPSIVSCGHMFCWECIGDWLREKPECPLCRREAVVKHILPLRA